VRRYGETSDFDKQLKHISRIKESVNILTDILNDMLSLSKLEEGKVAFVPERFNFKSFAEEIVYELQAIAKPDQKIIYHHTGQAEAVLDKKIKKHLFYNLISNAIKFSPEGGIIEVSSDFDGRWITLKVKDNGIGISPEDQQPLFERFFRGHNATNIQGTGLGLNIVAKYIEMLGGTIHLESELNKGTTFIIKLPNHESDGKENTAY